jgi:hypothetical protein
MDSDGSGRLSFHELCTEIKKLVRRTGLERGVGNCGVQGRVKGWEKEHGG